MHKDSSPYNTQKEAAQARDSIAKRGSCPLGWIPPAGFSMLWETSAVITLQLLLALAVLSESGPAQVTKSQC